MKTCCYKRTIIGIQIFMVIFTLCTVCTNLSVSIGAMVIQYPNASQTMEQVNPNYGNRFEWDVKIEGLLLGAYDWGSTIASFIGSYLIEKCSATKLVGIASLSSIFLTLIGPFAAEVHWVMFFFFRFAVGLTGGLIFPTVQCLIGQWVPPVERGKFMVALLAGSLGTIVTWFILTICVHKFGWIWAFYVPSLFVAVWTIIWFLTVSDTPAQHSCITEVEMNYIISSIGATSGKVKRTPPYLHMFTSLPFWAVTVSYFGQVWGFFMMLKIGPNFLAKSLALDLGPTGWLSLTQHTSRIFIGFVFGAINDSMHKTQVMTVTHARKFFHLFSHIIPGLLMVYIGYVTKPYLGIMLLITMMGIGGSVTVTSLQNCHDLAPNYAGTIYGIIKGFGNTVVFVAPMLSRHFNKNGNTLEDWCWNFFVGAGMYFSTGLIFMIWGSGRQQSFNDL